jgi:hypothetical protein
LAFQIPAPAGHLPKNRFEFQLPGEKEKRSIPKLDYLPIEADEYLRGIENRMLPQREYILGLVEATDAEIGKLLRDERLTRDQVNAFYDAWRAASKVSEGESSGSSQS